MYGEILPREVTAADLLPDELCVHRHLSVEHVLKLRGTEQQSYRTCGTEPRRPDSAAGSGSGPGKHCCYWGQLLQLLCNSDAARYLAPEKRMVS